LADETPIKKCGRRFTSILMMSVFSDNTTFSRVLKPPSGDILVGVGMPTTR
jgi:hypothetical protein